jgi:thiamine biosynthesis protein ThiS
VIEITLNGERKTLSRPVSVLELVDDFGLDPRRVATEINREIVPNTHYTERCLQTGDAVEIVTLVGGGEPSPSDKPLRLVASRSGRASSPGLASTQRTTSCATAWPRAVAR